MVEKLYKITDSNGKASQEKDVWSFPTDDGQPGEWMVSDVPLHYDPPDRSWSMEDCRLHSSRLLVLETKGYQLYDVRRGSIIFEAEVGSEVNSFKDTFGVVYHVYCTKARLAKKVGVVTDDVLVKFCYACVERAMEFDRLCGIEPHEVVSKMLDIARSGLHHNMTRNEFLKVRKDVWEIAKYDEIHRHSVSIWLSLAFYSDYPYFDYPYHPYLYGHYAERVLRTLPMTGENWWPKWHLLWNMVAKEREWLSEYFFELVQNEGVKDERPNGR